MFSVNNQHFRTSCTILLLLVGTVGLSGCFESKPDGRVNPDGQLTLSAAKAEESDGEVRAFPGAQGFGTETAGGRGGDVCVVENTADSGSGSLRACIEIDTPRIVVFNTGGVIEVSEPLVIKNPYISIFGQTATGDGITVRSSHTSGQSPMNVATHDVLVQHMRFRAGSSLVPTCCRDAMRIGSDTPGSVYNVVIDHNSFSWGTDQIANTWYDSHNITFSHNIFSESLHDNGSNESGPGGRGLLIGSEGAHSISVHHNFFAHSYQRNPMIATGGVVDVVNNLIFHWVSRGGEQDAKYDGQKVNWVKNRYLALKNSQTKFGQETTVNWGDILLTTNDRVDEPVFYVEGNIGHNRSHPFKKEWALVYTDYLTPYKEELGLHSEVRFDAPAVTEIDATKLMKELTPFVGATLPKRDAHDVRMIEELRDKKGKMPNCVGPDDLGDDDRCENNSGGWIDFSAGTPRVDSDKDGMPDEWEKINGLNPEVDDSKADIDNNGYSNIEDWVHSIR